MNYKPRPGIVAAPLCGMNVLIPSRIAGDACKTIFPLTLMGAIVWTGIEKDYPIEKVLEAFRIFSKKPDEELLAKIDDFCLKLVDKGFAIPKEEDPGSGVQCAPQPAPCSGAQCASQPASPVISTLVPSKAEGEAEKSVIPIEAGVPDGPLAYNEEAQS